MLYVIIVYTVSCIFGIIAAAICYTTFQFCGRFLLAIWDLITEGLAFWIWHSWFLC